MTDPMPAIRNILGLPGELDPVAENIERAEGAHDSALGLKFAQIATVHQLTALTDTVERLVDRLAPAFEGVRFDFSDEVGRAARALPGVVTCSNCHRERRPNEKDYSPVDLVMARMPGWYSGDDGELCGECMTNLFTRANRGGL